MKEKQFIHSLRKLENIFSKYNILTPQEQEDFIDNIEDLEEVSDSMDQLINKKIINFDKDYLNLLCNLNSNIVDIEGDINELSKLLNSIGKRIEK